MHVIIRTVRRPDRLPGTVTRLQAVGDQYLFPAVEAETHAGRLTADHQYGPGRPRWTARKLYLPACVEHDEHSPDCAACTDTVSEWLEEIRESTTARTDPSAVGG